MRKTTLLLLIFVQIVAVFLFQNIHSLFTELEKRETRQFVETKARLAEWLVGKYHGNTTAMQNERLFDEIRIVTAQGRSEWNEKRDKAMVHCIRLPLTETTGLEFNATIDSPTLQSARSLKTLFAVLFILTVLILLISAFYLVHLHRKGRDGEKVAPGIDPLQNYLLDLKSSQQQLLGMVDQQSRSARKSDELNRTIVNRIHIAIIFLNAGGRIEIFNHTAQQYFQRSPVHTLNNTLSAALAIYPRLAALAQSLEECRAREHEENGRIFRLDAVVLPDTGRLLLIRDITEEKNRERIQSQRDNFIMLGEMAASLAHEIKNSLGVIYGYAKSIKPETEKTQHIGKEVVYLTSMMESFLHFSRPITTVEAAEVDLVPLLRKTATENDLRLECGETSWSLPSDPVLLQVIVSNLFLNARQNGADTIRIVFRKGDDGSEVEIIDNGRGIAEKDREKIWLPFFSTRTDGSGMGLAIVKKMVGALNGDISVPHTSPGRTVFRLRFLPVSAGETADTTR